MAQGDKQSSHLLPTYIFPSGHDAKQVSAFKNLNYEDPSQDKHFVLDSEHVLHGETQFLH